MRRIEAVADAFGGRHVSAGEFRGGVPVDLSAAGRRLEELARRLGGRGLQVAVEAFPWSVLAGPAAVPELLRQVQVPNLGQMVDVWHFFHNGGTADALTGPIAAVQLNDGRRWTTRPAVARAARRLPGEGELDVAGLLRAVLRNGFTRPWCVEVKHRSSVHSRSARPLAGQSGDSRGTRCCRSTADTGLTRRSAAFPGAIRAPRRFAGAAPLPSR